LNLAARGILDIGLIPVKALGNNGDALEEIVIKVF